MNKNTILKLLQSLHIVKNIELNDGFELVVKDHSNQILIEFDCLPKGFDNCEFNDILSIIALNYEFNKQRNKGENNGNN